MHCFLIRGTKDHHEAADRRPSTASQSLKVVYQADGCRFVVLTAVTLFNRSHGIASTCCGELIGICQHNLLFVVGFLLLFVVGFVFCVIKSTVPAFLNVVKYVKQN